MTRPIDDVLPSINYGVKSGMFCPHLKRYRPNPFLNDFYYCNNSKSNKAKGDEPCLINEWMNCIMCLPIALDEARSTAKEIAMGSPAKKKRRGIFGRIDNILGVTGRD